MAEDPFASFEPRIFQALYYGRCLCGDPIEPGDSVAYDEDDDLVHEECL